ncbi:MAG TPA: DoxX family protein [Mycobacteriales bacterium]|jgi:uncharacterized membrane protein YphA (DoxX/SURF4 family)|nr:hypothetical protein [Cryptosporangiaceae bacterium]MDQ1674919.1 hypothetical protein [Actinomycetota bacterium]HEV7754616.1 DoxX family protein [Mycobacteriales bacterium]
MQIATIVLSVLLAAVIVASALFKVVRNPTGADAAYDLGYPIRLWRVVGWLEILGALGLLVGLFYRPVGEAAAILVIVLMLGLVISHLRVRAAVAKLGTPLALGALAAVTLLLHVEMA